MLTYYEYTQNYLWYANSFFTTAVFYNSKKLISLN